MKRLLGSVSLILSGAAMCFAQTFSAKNSDNVNLYYTITSSTNHTCELVASQSGTAYSGAINIPSNASYNGVDYSVTEIGSAAFFVNSGVTSISLPASVTILNEACFRGCSALTEFLVDAANEHYYSENGVLFNKDVTTLLVFPSAKNVTNYVIPSTVTVLDSYCFYSCKNLTEIQLSPNLEIISDAAFFECTSLKSLALPVTVDSIGASAFYDCTSLKVLIDESNVPPHVSDYAFAGLDQSTCVLYVPEIAVATYKGDDDWDSFTNIEEIDSTVGVNSINLDSPRMEIYDVKGIPVAGHEIPLKGIFIVKYGTKVYKVIRNN